MKPFINSISNLSNFETTHEENRKKVSNKLNLFETF